MLSTTPYPIGPHKDVKGMLHQLTEPGWDVNSSRIDVLLDRVGTDEKLFAMARTAILQAFRGQLWILIKFQIEALSQGRKEDAEFFADFGKAVRTRISQCARGERIVMNEVFCIPGQAEENTSSNRWNTDHL